MTDTTNQVKLLAEVVENYEDFTNEVIPLVEFLNKLKNQLIQIEPEIGSEKEFDPDKLVLCIEVLQDVITGTVCDEQGVLLADEKISYLTKEFSKAVKQVLKIILSPSVEKQGNVVVKQYSLLPVNLNELTQAKTLLACFDTSIISKIEELLGTNSSILKTLEGFKSPKVTKGLMTAKILKPLDIDGADVLFTKWKDIKGKIRVLNICWEQIFKFINNLMVFLKTLTPVEETEKVEVTNILILPDTFTDNYERITKISKEIQVYGGEFSIRTILKLKKSNLFFPEEENVFTPTADSNFSPSIEDILLYLSKGEGLVKLPPCQRGYVWSPRQKSALLVSLLEGLYLPPIFISYDGMLANIPLFSVMDGQQRLRTLDWIISDKELIYPFGFKALDDFCEINGLKSIAFSMLPEDVREQLLDFNIQFMLYDFSYYAGKNILAFLTNRFFQKYNNGKALTIAELTANDSMLPDILSTKFKHLYEISKDFLKFVSGEEVDINYLLLKSVIELPYAGSTGDLVNFMKESLTDNNLYDQDTLALLEAGEQPNSEIKISIVKNSKILQFVLEISKNNSIVLNALYTPLKTKGVQRYKFNPFTTWALLTVWRLTQDINDLYSSESVDKLEQTCKNISTEVKYLEEHNDRPMYKLRFKNKEGLLDYKPLEKEEKDILNVMKFINPSYTIGSSVVEDLLTLLENLSYSEGLWAKQTQSNTALYHRWRLLIVLFSMLDDYIPPVN